MAQKDQFIIIDKVKWWLWTKDDGSRGTQPFCLKHNIRMYPQETSYQKYSWEYNHLKCTECKSLLQLPRTLNDEKQYILDKVESKILKSIKFINLDDEALPIAESKIPKDSKYFVTSVLTKSKVGLRLIVYAGENGKAEKTQIFVEPEIRRLAFDQTNLHPADVFTKVEATFADGTKANIEKKK
jgi:hypothetical protein